MNRLAFSKVRGRPLEERSFTFGALEGHDQANGGYFKMAAPFEHPHSGRCEDGRMSGNDRQTELLEEILAVQKEQLQWLKNRERAYWKMAIWITGAVLAVTVALVFAIPLLEKL
jgi:hypothetical protein